MANVDKKKYRKWLCFLATYNVFGQLFNQPALSRRSWPKLLQKGKWGGEREIVLELADFIFCFCDFCKLFALFYLLSNIDFAILSRRSTLFLQERFVVWLLSNVWFNVSLMVFVVTSVCLATCVGVVILLLLGKFVWTREWMLASRS